MTDSTEAHPDLAFAFTMRGVWDANKELSVSLDALKAKVSDVTATEEVGTAVDTILVPAFDVYQASYARSMQLVDDQIAKGTWAPDRRVAMFRKRVDDFVAVRDQIAALSEQLHRGALSLPNAWQAVFEILASAMPGGDDDE